MRKIKADDAAAVDRKYRTLNSRYNNLYRFVMHYATYIYSTHSYGGAVPLTMIEVHTLSYIEDNPGTTSSELVRYWDKTKGAISQILTRLADCGLISKEKTKDDGKTIHLYVTEEGRRLSMAHKLYDINDIAKTVSHLRKECTAEEIDTFFKVIGVYNDVMRKDFELNGGRRAGSKKK